MSETPARIVLIDEVPRSAPSALGPPVLGTAARREEAKVKKTQMLLGLKDELVALKIAIQEEAEARQRISEVLERSFKPSILSMRAELRTAIEDEMRAREEAVAGVSAMVGGESLSVVHDRFESWMQPERTEIARAGAQREEAVRRQIDEQYGAVQEVMGRLQERLLAWQAHQEAVFRALPRPLTYDEWQVEMPRQLSQLSGALQLWVAAELKRRDEAWMKALLDVTTREREEREQQWLMAMSRIEELERTRRAEESAAAVEALRARQQEERVARERALRDSLASSPATELPRPTLEAVPLADPQSVSSTSTPSSAPPALGPAPSLEFLGPARLVRPVEVVAPTQPKDTLVAEASSPSVRSAPLQSSTSDDETDSRLVHPQAQASERSRSVNEKAISMRETPVRGGGERALPCPAPPAEAGERRRPPPPTRAATRAGAATEASAARPSPHRAARPVSAYAPPAARAEPAAVPVAPASVQIASSDSLPVGRESVRPGQPRRRLESTAFAFLPGERAVRGM